MHVAKGWAGIRLRSAVRLALGMLLGACAVVPGFLDLTATNALPFRVVTAVLSAAFIASVVATFVRVGFNRDSLREVAPSTVLLVAVAVIEFSLLGSWSGEAAVVGIICFYALEARNVIVASPLLYAVVAMGGVVVVASLAMADTEREAPNSPIASAGDSLEWALAQVFRAGALVDATPVTDSGQFLGFVILASSLIFAAVIFSGITAWAVRDRHRQAEDGSVRQEVREALAEAGLLPTKEEPGRAAVPLVLVDVDDVVGRLPRNWWRDRDAAIAEFLDDCAAMIPRGDVSMVAVLDDVPPGPNPGATEGLEIVESADGAGPWIIRHMSAGDTVVSGDAGVVDAARSHDVAVVRPRDWRRALEGTA